MNIDRNKILEELKTVYPFHRKEERLLYEVIAACDVRKFHKGDMIYTEGVEPHALFLVLSGQIELNRFKDEESRSLVRLTSGDFLGFELFEGEGRYRTNAIALKETALLVFDEPHLQELIQKFPWFRLGLQTMMESFRQASRIKLDWIGPDEVIYFISKRHNAFLFQSIIFPVVLTIAFLLLFLFVVILGINPVGYGTLCAIGLAGSLFACGWVYLDWTNDFSIITNQRVVFQEKVILLYDSRQEAPMHAVLKVDTATNQLGRWLGFGNVIASTYAGLVILQGLNRPEEAAAILLAGSERANLKQRKIERDELDVLLRNRLNVTEENLSQPNPEEVPVQIRPGRLQIMLANMFRMRFEEGPKITYRTHWFILFLKLLIPSILVVGTIVVWLLQRILLPGVFPVTVSSFFIGCLMLAGIAVWIYQYTDWRNDYYVVTMDQIVDVYKKPLGREERQAAPLKNIQSIEFKRKGILGLVLNYGTVFIRVGDAELTFDNVYNPAEVQRDLFHRIAEWEFQEKQKALTEEKIRLADWIEAYHLYRQENRQEENPDSTSNI